MTPQDVQPFDLIEPGKPVIVRRYNGVARLNHWVTALCLILLAISGLALFHPVFFPLTDLFGGGQNTRAIHPWIGVVLFFSFAGLFLRFWSANLFTANDRTWIAHYREVLSGDEEALPEVPRYNAGQKIVFWVMSLMIIALIITGLIIWEIYFASYTSVETRRYAVLIHSMAGVAIISVWIIHVYASIFVRGTFRAMTRGSVTGGWAWKHHRAWLKELVARRRIQGANDKKAAAE